MAAEFMAKCVGETAFISDDHFDLFTMAIKLFRDTMAPSAPRLDVRSTWDMPLSLLEFKRCAWHILQRT